jgi:toxin ParE1/3/4
MTAAADDDFHRILGWTAERYGGKQAQTYRQTIIAAAEVLRGGPGIRGVKRRDDLREGVMTLHIARNRRKGRHLLAFRLGKTTRTIEVLRILHDAMDLTRHLPLPEDEPGRQSSS